MRFILMAFLLSMSTACRAAFTSSAQIKVTYDSDGDPIIVEGCAHDNAVGRVCASIDKDFLGRPFSLTAQGDFQNKTAVKAALVQALRDARDEKISVRQKDVADAARRGKASLPISDSDLE